MEKTGTNKLENLVLDYVAKKEVKKLVKLLLLSPGQSENFAQKVTQFSSPEGVQLFHIALNKAQYQRSKNAEREKGMLEYLQRYAGRRIEIYTEPYWRYLINIFLFGDILPICKVLPNMAEETIEYLSVHIKQTYPKDYACFRMFLHELTLAKALLESQTEFIPRPLLAQRMEISSLTQTEAAMYLIHLRFVSPHKFEGLW